MERFKVVERETKTKPYRYIANLTFEKSNQRFNLVAKA